MDGWDGMAEEVRWGVRISNESSTDITNDSLLPLPVVAWVSTSRYLGL